MSTNNYLLNKHQPRLDSNLAVLLTERKIAPNVSTAETRLVFLDEAWSSIAQFSGENLVHNSKPADVVYILYTSGSSGKPKGVQIMHQSVVNLLWHLRKTPGITSQDTMLALTTVCFDIAVTELLLPLVVGAKIVLAPREAAQDPNKFSRILQEADVTIAQATPSAWRVLIASGWEGTKGLKMLTVGEMLSRDLSDELLARGRSLFNLYGPTETTVYSVMCEVTKESHAGLIGRPVANTKLHLVSPTTCSTTGKTMLQPVPVGSVGELYIGGDGLARGYLNRPDITKEKFIPNPFNSDLETRLYATGDLARYLPDGSLECLGRNDHQIKIRGFRIELGDIEATIRDQDCIRAAVVVARVDHHTEEKELAAYIIADVDEQAQSKAQAQQWETIWDETYRQCGDYTEEESLNLTGWISSYTGMPTPVEEMHEWIGHTIDRILALKPNRLFEIGCGSGLLLYRLVDHCHGSWPQNVPTELQVTVSFPLSIGHLNAKQIARESKPKRLRRRRGLDNS